MHLLARLRLLSFGALSFIPTVRSIHTVDSRQRTMQTVPLRVFVLVQGGRNYILALLGSLGLSLMVEWVGLFPYIAC